MKSKAERYIEEMRNAHHELCLRYIATLETALNKERERVEFYRGKCERLELAIMNNTAAQQSYAARTDAPAKPDIRDRKFVDMPQQLPFSEIKRRWNNLTEAQQEKAIAEGWNVDAPPKEETNAGK